MVTRGQVSADEDGGAGRGETLRRRRLALGIKSVRELQQRSGVSREAITSAEAGTASAATYERLDAWFARQESGEDAGAGQVEFEVHSEEGLRVVVRGHITEVEELARSVAR
ncbi:MAG: hypothetical protein ACXVW4_03460, partial [Nocardioides sp.]